MKHRVKLRRNSKHMTNEDMQSSSQRGPKAKALVGNHWCPLLTCEYIVWLVKRSTIMLRALNTVERTEERRSNAKAKDDDGEKEAIVLHPLTPAYSFCKTLQRRRRLLGDEVQDNLEKSYVEVKRSSVNAKKMSQKSAHRQAKKQTTTQPQRKNAIKQHQPEKSSTAGQKKTSMWVMKLIYCAQRSRLEAE